MSLVPTSSARRVRREAPPARGTDQRERTLAVLVSARALVSRGWLQGAWYVLEARDGRRQVVPAGALTRRRGRTVARACLVGAVVEAEHAHGPARDAAGPAIDALWQTLREDQGLPPAPARYVPSPSARAVRARDLTRWNDQHDRTQGDVVRLLDLTIDRVAGPDPGAAR